jgi:hypothetical protein
MRKESQQIYYDTSQKETSSFSFDFLKFLSIQNVFTSNSSSSRAHNERRTIARARFLRRREKEDEKNVHARGARKARAFGGKKVGKRGKETIVAREKGVARCEESGEDGNVDDEFFARRGVGGERGRGR